MTKLTVEMPRILALRLEALAKLSGEGAEDLARKALEDFAGSRASRRAILKSRRDAAKSAGTTCSLADLGWLDG